MNLNFPHYSFGKLNIGNGVQLPRTVLTINTNTYQIFVFKLIKPEKVTTLIVVHIGSLVETLRPTMTLSTHSEPNRFLRRFIISLKLLHLLLKQII